MPGASSQRAPELCWIQVERGIAAVLVVLTHATLVCQRQWGIAFLDDRVALGAEVGVSFFFVLSGFIIVYVHHGDIGRPHRLIPYAQKRFTRIYPLYWVVSLALLPVYFLLPAFWADDEKGWAYLLKSFLLLPQDALPLLSVGWTLTHEVFFYAVFGLAIGLRRRYSVPIIALLLALTLYKFVSDWGLPLQGTRYQTGSTVLDGSDWLAFTASRFNLLFLVGAIVGFAVVRFSFRPPVAVGVVAGIAILLPMVFPTSMSGVLAVAFSTNGGSILYWAALSGLIVWASARPSNGAPRLGMALGDASYSIYLTHYPLLIASALGMAIIAPSLTPGPILGQFLTLTLIAIAIALGVLCYRWVERPLLRWCRSTMSRAGAGRSP